MIFATAIFNSPFESKEGEIPVFVMENKQMYRKFILNMFNELEGKDSEHNFYIEDKDLDLKKDLEIIVNYFDLDINKTKNLTKLYSYIKSEFINEEKYLETNALTSKITGYIDSLIEEVDFKLIYDSEIQIQDIFKIIDLKFYYEDSGLLEQLMDYVKILSDFFKKKLFILSNFKGTFSKEEQMEFYKFCEYSKINVFIVESEQPPVKLPNEIYRTIDDDLCVIY